jgi:homoserine kinase
VRVQVPATSANLGPGFDALGLALALYDEVVVRTADDPDVHVEVVGEGAGVVAGDATNLVVRSLVAGLESYGVASPGLRVTCTNRIPHGRGLGSSAAAIVAGLVAAAGLVGAPIGPALLPLAGDIEGHPDNVAAALLGGATVAWCEAGDSRRARAVRLEPHAELCAVAYVPAEAVATSVARGLLPAHVPHADAARNAGRAALLVEALTRRPDLLLAATEDCLHQGYRGPAMPATLELVEALRRDGVAAVVSGAGPTVLALTTSDDAAAVAARPVDGFVAHVLDVDGSGATVTVGEPPG